MALSSRAGTIAPVDFAEISVPIPVLRCIPRLLMLTMILRLFAPVSSGVMVDWIPGRLLGLWIDGDISSGTVRAFGSGRGPGR